MKRSLITVIMAARKGKRMKNPDKSKVMYEFKSKPMIEHVTELAMKINSVSIIPIVGHKKETVIEHLNNIYSGSIDKIKYAHQDEQLGTGHAVMQTEEYLKKFDGIVLILSGDVPMLTFDTVKTFIEFHDENNFDASLISAVFEDPTGYGRVLRDSEGNFFDIREEKDCNEEERKCKEINSGIYLIDNKILFEALKTLSTENAQGEYYLTDIFKYFKSIGKKIGALPVKNNHEISGINTVEQLEELEKIF